MNVIAAPLDPSDEMVMVCKKWIAMAWSVRTFKMVLCRRSRHNNTTQNQFQHEIEPIWPSNYEFNTAQLNPWKFTCNFACTTMRLRISAVARLSSVIRCNGMSASYDMVFMPLCAIAAQPTGENKVDEVNTFDILVTYWVNVRAANFFFFVSIFTFILTSLKRYV